MSISWYIYSTLNNLRGYIVIITKHGVRAPEHAILTNSLSPHSDQYNFFRSRFFTFSRACYWLQGIQIGFIIILRKKWKRNKNLLIWRNFLLGTQANLVVVVVVVCVCVCVCVLFANYFSCINCHFTIAFDFLRKNIHSLWFFKQHNYPIQESTSAKLYITDVSVNLFRYSVILHL